MREHTIYRTFRLSVILKGLHAVIEVIGGLLLYFISSSTISTVVASLTQDELNEDSHDYISHLLLNSAQHFSVGAQSFAAFYLLSHGVVKIVLVGGLLRNKYWAYPASIVVMGAFIAYQIYRYTFTHSVGLIVLTIFDLLVIALVWHEYGRVRRHQALDSE